MSKESNEMTSSLELNFCQQLSRFFGSAYLSIEYNSVNPYNEPERDLYSKIINCTQKDKEAIIEIEHNDLVDDFYYGEVHVNKRTTVKAKKNKMKLPAPREKVSSRLSASDSNAASGKKYDPESFKNMRAGFFCFNASWKNLTKFSIGAPDMEKSAGGEVCIKKIR